MSKKHIFAVAFATVALVQGALAQTNFQLFYDFGKDRKIVTGTIEGFYTDPWGSTFFFADFDYPEVKAPSGTYLEVARNFTFWKESKFSMLNLHVEYNGGVYKGFAINNALLVGADVSFNNLPLSITGNNSLSFQLLYKKIAQTKSSVPLQLTFIWSFQDIFGVKGLRFNGFADFWFEDHYVSFDEEGNAYATPQLSSKIFITEPQVWYNVGQHFGVPNLNLGGEVELSYNFGNCRGFRARPCLGAKWVF